MLLTWGSLVHYKPANVIGNMWTLVVMTVSLGLCGWAFPQHTPASTQPQQYSQAQLIAYLQQQQAQAQQQTQVTQQLAQQTPQTFQAAPQQQQYQPAPQQQQYQPAPQQQVYQAAPQQQAPQPAQQFLPQQLQQPQRPLLGVAYSSAADASKTSFNGYGISYNF